VSRRDKGDGSIYYSESRRRWVAQIEAPPSVDGTRRYLRRFRPTRKAAVDALHQLRRDVERQRHPDANQTLADWLERWVTRLEGVRAPKTVAAYRADVAHISDVIGWVQLSKLQPEHVHNLLAQLPKRGLAPKSALNIRTTLHTAIAQAVKDRMIDWNPVSVVDRPRVQRHDSEVFTLDEANADLERLADAVRAAGVEVDLDVAEPPTRLPAAVELTGYRIVQESLTNVIRHAHAGRAEVTVVHRPGAVTITVSDDGEAPAGAPGETAGFGLTGMRERAAAIGGSLTAGPRADGGFEVHAVLPTGTAAPAGEHADDRS
jgi:hypothetical protein